MKEYTTKLITGHPLPLVVEPTEANVSLSSLQTILKRDNKFFREKLLEHGGILLRNFPVTNEQDFESVIQALGLGSFIDYIGGDSPRTKLTKGVYTSTEAPPSIKIQLHNELSYVKNYPKHIYFFCMIAPKDKGETIIADARQVYRSVEADVRKRFDDRGLKYVSRYFYKSPLMDLVNSFQKAHKSWIDVFETSSKKEVEEKCRQGDFQFRWNQNDWLEISQIRPASIDHPITKDAVWFNQAHLYDFNPKHLGWLRYAAAKAFYCREHMRLHEIFYADGSKIPRKDLYHVLDVLNANTLAFPWKKGDVLILDNVLSMHGRATFKGPRRVLTAMTG